MVDFLGWSWHISIAYRYCTSSFHMFLAYLYRISRLRIFIAYVYCMSLLHISVGYLYSISILHISVAVLLSFVAWVLGSMFGRLGGVLSSFLRFGMLVLNYLCCFFLGLQNRYLNLLQNFGTNTLSYVYLSAKK